MLHRNEMIDAHASLHLYQIQMEAERARKHIRRLAEFPARLAGQRKRYQKQRNQTAA